MPVTARTTTSFVWNPYKPAFLLLLGGSRSKICQSLENVGLQESFQQVFFKLIASSGRLLDPSEPTAKTSKIFVSENFPIPGGHYPFWGGIKQLKCMVILRRFPEK